MEIITNNKGGVKLCNEGFLYTKKKTSNTGIIWECSQRNALSCKGTAKTDANMQQILYTTNHCHDASRAKVAAAKLKTAVKTAATDTRGRPGQILTDMLSQQPVEVRYAAGQTETLKRNIRRVRNGTLPKDPASLRDLSIEGVWRTTGEPDNNDFLIHDSGPQNQNRVILFATNESLRHLAGSDTWYMDGTFATVPRLFHQVFIIRAPIGDTAITCVYGFLSSKTQSTYEEVLRAVVNKCEEIGLIVDPVTVITDFEKALINAVSTVLGHHVEHQGCYYHLTQSTLRKVQQLGLYEFYQNNDTVKYLCNMLDGLAFLPVDYVEDGLEYVINSIPQDEDYTDGLEALVTYFDTVYVRGSFRQMQPRALANGNLPPVRMRRLPPLYPPKFWNVHEQTVNGEDRTNNVCESWNRGFRELVGHDHPTVWKAIECFRKDNAMVTTDIYRDMRGEPPRKRQKRATLQHQRRLQTLCEDFTAGRRNIAEFLRGIAHNIRL